MRRIIHCLLALLPAFVLAGCITDPVTGRTVVGAPISEAQESAMGIEYKPAITQEYSGPYPDAEAQRYLGGIVMRIAKASVRPELPWEFTILNSSVPNAFAVPGGQVFVTRGLLADLEDEAEFAVVMGHEVGHVEHRHSVQAMGRGQLLGAGAAILGEVADAKLGAGAGEYVGVGAQLWSLKYGRDDETEADVRGVDQSYRLGYDPREGADVFRLFLRMKQEQGGATPAWLSSHPADEDRIANVLALSAQKDPRLAGKGPVPGLTVQTPQFASIVARMKAAQKTYDRADAALARIAQANGSEASIRAAIPEVEAAARELPSHALLASTAGKLRLVIDDNDGAEPWLNRAAALRQGIAEPEYLLGILSLRRKRWDDAVRHCDAALAIFPQHYAALYRRGTAHAQAGRTQAAETDFRAVLQIAPAESNEYKQAAQVLGGGQQQAPKQAKPNAATNRTRR